MKIPLETAFDLLGNASAVIVEDSNHPVIYPSLAPLSGEGDDDNQFAYFSWEIEGEEFEIILTEGLNREVEWSGSQLTFSDGEPFTITLLVPIQYSLELLNVLKQ